MEFRRTNACHTNGLVFPSSNKLELSPLPYNEHHTGSYTLEHAGHDPHASTPPAHVLACSGRVHPVHARARCAPSPQQNGLSDPVQLALVLRRNMRTPAL